MTETPDRPDDAADHVEPADHTDHVEPVDPAEPADRPMAAQSPRRPEAGAPPLPGTTPEPLASAREASARETPARETPVREPSQPSPGGAHRAPASLDHSAYAGSHSAAYAELEAARAAGVGADSGAGESLAAGITAGPASDPSRDPSRPSARRRSLGAFVTVAVVSAVIGALVATGGYALLSRNDANDAAGSSSSLTVNDYKSATVVTAVAAKATPSVVTIDVASGDSAGTGSGVILDSTGDIVTNTHVVTLDGASATGTISVTLSNGRIYPGKVVGLDPLVDLAVIKIDATGLTPISFADSSKINVGATAVAIGAPLGLSNTVTDGIISTLNRSITVQSSAVPDSGGTSSGSQSNNGQGPFSFDNGTGSTTQTTATISLPVLQTDASINPGNSGGALLDSKGRLIGINVAIASAPSTSSSGASSSSGGSIGVGFAIPSDLVERVATSIVKTGSATHGQLGASINDATSDTSATQTGALIVSLTAGGPAAAAGLRAGDVVTRVDGISVTDATDLTAQIRTLAGGAVAKLTYVRDGDTKVTTVTLGTLKG